MHNEGDMKRKGAEPATKADLDRFATKEDLARFAAETNSRMDELTSEARRQCAMLGKIEASMDGLREDVVSVIKGMESRLTERMDSFMSNTLRVDRDNILLVHRLDKVEGRVSDLERRAP